MRDDYGVSWAAADLAVTCAIRAGALGARMTGGGFGGSVIVLVPGGRSAEVTTAIADAFAREGHHPPRLFPAVPSAAARRIS